MVTTYKKFARKIIVHFEILNKKGVSDMSHVFACCAVSNGPIGFKQGLKCSKSVVVHYKITNI